MRDNGVVCWTWTLTALIPTLVVSGIPGGGAAHEGEDSVEYPSSVLGELSADRVLCRWRGNWVDRGGRDLTTEASKAPG